MNTSLNKLMVTNGHDELLAYQILSIVPGFVINLIVNTFDEIFLIVVHVVGLVVAFVVFGTIALFSA